MTQQLSFPINYRYDSSKGGITIPATVSVGNLTVDCFAKVDTGAEFCLFQRTIADLLQLDLATGEPIRFSTLTGNFVAYGHEVTLQTFGLTFDAMVYFAESHSVTRNLLGRHGWLQRVQLGLRDYEEMLYLDDYERATNE
jgi:hypothetical protein